MLHEGKIEEFLAATDEAIARTRDKSRLAILTMNRAAAYAHAGDFAKGIEIYDTVDPSAPKGPMRSVYWLNLVNMLIYADKARAREIYETHRDELSRNKHYSISLRRRCARCWSPRSCRWQLHSATANASPPAATAIP